MIKDMIFARPKHNPRAFQDTFYRYRAIAQRWNCNPGCPKAAAISWDTQIDSGATVEELVESLDAFEEVCQAKSQVVMPHFARYLNGSRLNSTPCWRLALDWKARQSNNATGGDSA